LIGLLGMVLAERLVNGLGPSWATDAGARMKPYLISLLMGLLAGLIYAALHVQSPAPPIIALLGLLGMLIGEQLVPIVRRKLAGEPLSASWFHRECMPKITGTPPPDGQ
jgi:XapX domain-containing protein